jgi:hypothetical protein
MTIHKIEITNETTGKNKTIEVFKEVFYNHETQEIEKTHFTDSEFADWNELNRLANLENAKAKEDLALKAKTRQSAEAKLLALGLTTEDLKALLG